MKDGKHWVYDGIKLGNMDMILEIWKHGMGNLTAHSSNSKTYENHQWSFMMGNMMGHFQLGNVLLFSIFILKTYIFFGGRGVSISGKGLF